MGKPFTREPEAGDAVAWHQFGKETENSRVQMDVEVPIQVGKCDARINDLPDLGFYLPPERFVEPLVKEVAHAGRYRVVTETARIIHQARYF